MKSLRARVALTTMAATAAALLLAIVVVVGSFALEFRMWEQSHGPLEQGQESSEWGPDNLPPWAEPPEDGEWDGPPPFIRTVALRLGAAGLVVFALVGAVGLLLGRMALQPLASLSRTTVQVVSTDDLSTRLPDAEGPEEVRDLAANLNAMLSRIETSTRRTEDTLAASRQFTADAGHELRTPLTSMRANLDVLARTGDLTPQQQGILHDVMREQYRLLTLLDGLQRLARADAAEAIPRANVDLSEVVDAAITAARTRYPDLTIDLNAPDELQVDGWADGLRLIVDNLVENAARHGAAEGHVEVTVAADHSTVTLTVDDDGPGIPPDERDHVRARFGRGAGTNAPGHGLGLALVEQLARVHGGSVSIGQAPLGGARVVVTI